ncbi:uncharacterized protein RCC_02523 [Ramularia collo-cygni]|uniref:Uncharacterized protein n=1 Tax=Ramularia collo-cygni TaxID=112498 RepID=A0A2D3UQQ2_9PEZI|nr:uncharacterized protein RCC_02523 [Ramularia collo-cygni]CZT16688.1 uncharacterized protein RCC_02523 [Ramularia collo-cygni]
MLIHPKGSPGNLCPHEVNYEAGRTWHASRALRTRILYARHSSLDCIGQDIPNADLVAFPRSTYYAPRK